MAETTSLSLQPSRADDARAIVTMRKLRKAGAALIAACVAIGVVRQHQGNAIPSVKRKLGATYYLLASFEERVTDAETRVEDDFWLAYEQSFGFFDDIPRKTWKLLQERASDEQRLDHHSEYYTVLRACPGCEGAGLWYQYNFEPNFTCNNERRVGGMGDGPKWVCNPHRIPTVARARKETEEGPSCLVYSIGSSGNFLFEKGLQEMIGDDACSIHSFDLDDYSQKAEEQAIPNLFFHPWGIESSENEEMLAQSNVKSLQQTVEQLGHKGRTVDIFKIDCEECEWRTYMDWFRSGIDIRQIQVEVHGVPDNANDFFDELRRQGFVAFHKEWNAYANGGVQEYAFVKLSPEFFEGKN